MNRLIRFIVDLIVFILGIMNIYKGFNDDMNQFYTGVIMLLPLIVLIIDEIILERMTRRFLNERNDFD